MPLLSTCVEGLDSKDALLIDGDDGDYVANAASSTIEMAESSSEAERPDSDTFVSELPATGNSANAVTASSQGSDSTDPPHNASPNIPAETMGGSEHVLDQSDSSPNIMQQQATGISSGAAGAGQTQNTDDSSDVASAQSTEQVHNTAQAQDMTSISKTDETADEQAVAANGPSNQIAGISSDTDGPVTDGSETDESGAIGDGIVASGTDGFGTDGSGAHGSSGSVKGETVADGAGAKTSNSPELPAARKARRRLVHEPYLGPR